MKKLFAKLIISFILVLFLVPLLIPNATHADPTDPPAIIISLSTETAARAGAGTNLVVSTSLDGAFTSQYLAYDVYIAKAPSATEPGADVTDAAVWEKYTVGFDNTITLSDDEIFDGVSNHALPTINWVVDPSTALGTRFIKATISDRQGTLISSAVTSVEVVENLITIDLTANSTTNFIDYDMGDSSGQPIAISATITPPDETTSYKGELWISTKGYSNSDDKFVSDAAHFNKQGQYEFEKSSSSQSYNVFWDVLSGPSALGFHEVVFKVYGNGNFLAKKTMWIKLYKPSAATGGTVTPPDNSDVDINDVARNVLGIKVSLQTYDGLIKTVKEEWFPLILGIFSFFGIIFGGWMYIMSAGDQAKADRGKRSLTYSVIGMAIAIGATAIINVSKSIVTKFKDATSITSGFETATNFIAVISGILAFIYLIYSGILFLTAAGNPDNAKKGLQGVINAAIGIVIIVGAWAIIRAVVGTLTQTL